ncbi:NAD(P)-dependent oxidoreductase [bacterium]|nr:NAD(P)-dependent oxidoreductase [bacterium]
MRIFVTGGSGFLGKQVIQSLLSDDHEVFALARSAKSELKINELGATVVLGDLGDVESYQKYLNGVDVVVHCAAPVEFWGPWEKYQEGMIDATQNLAKAADRAKIKRFIHISSESVLQDKDPLMNISESESYPEEPNSYYGKSKKIVEEFLLSTSFSMEVLIIRPTFIWGPDSNALSTILKKVRSNDFMWVDNGNASFEAVHVKNVAEIVRLALVHGKDKSVYFVTDDEEATVREFFSRVFDSFNVPIPTKSIPGFLGASLACSIEGLWRLLRLKSTPLLTRFDLSFVNMPRKYNISKAKLELKYRPIINRDEGFKSLK